MVRTPRDHIRPPSKDPGLGENRGNEARRTDPLKGQIPSPEGEAKEHLSEKIVKARTGQRRLSAKCSDSLEEIKGQDGLNPCDCV